MVESLESRRLLTATSFETLGLISGSASTGDLAGFSVDIDGDTAIVGSRQADPGTATNLITNAGAAQIFTRNSSGTWSREGLLIADDAAEGDHFGYSVSIDGDTAVVGAIFENSLGLNENGAAYVFRRNASGGWDTEQKLNAPDAENGDRFGTSVSIDGNTIVVGASLEDGVGMNASGAAYVFTRSGSAWSSGTKLVAASPASEDQFGFSVDVSGDIIVAGAFNDHVGPNEDQGSAHVFTRDGAGVWSAPIQLLASDGAELDRFGRSVRVDGSTVVVGSLFSDNGGISNAGAAYVFENNSGIWSSPTKLLASDGQASDSFGYSVDVDGDQILVGARYRDTAEQSDSGAAYLFRRNAGTWSEVSQFVASGSEADDFLGSSVAISDEYAIAGALNADTDSNTPNSGEAFLFQLNEDLGDAPFSYQQTLRSQDGPIHRIVPGFHLGNSIDMDSEGMAGLEAQGDDTDGSDDDDGVTFGQLKIGDTSATVDVVVTNTAGVANPYLDAWIDFNADGDWDDAGENIHSAAVTAGTNVLAFAVPDDAAIGQTFARFRLHDGTTALPTTGSVDSGEVEDYRVSIEFNVTNPEQVTRLLDSNGAEADRFGVSVSIDKDRAIVGAFKKDIGGGVVGGAAYIYEQNNVGEWRQKAELIPADLSHDDEFGLTVAIDGHWAAIGARNSDEGSLVDSGAVYTYFRNSSGDWTFWSRLVPTGIDSGDSFGRSLSLSGETLLVGAPFDDSGFTQNGAVYVYEFEGLSVWNQKAKLLASNPGNSDRFGLATAVDGDTAIIGAYLEDTGGLNTGAAYVFDRDAFGNWTEVELLKAPDASEGDLFGISVDVEGDRAIVGAYSEDFGGNTNTGAAYIFERDESRQWNPEATLRASNAADDDRFGYAVSIEGDRAVVGTSDRGAAYLYERDPVIEDWPEVHQFVPAPISAIDKFGYAVALSGQNVIAGSYLADPGGLSDAGAAFIFDLDSASDDWGDAPAPYPTLASEDGPVHAELAGFAIGTLWDDDYNGQASLEATGDDFDGSDDDDGVTFGQLKIGDTTATVDVFVTNTAGVSDPYLDAWIDFNADGDWDDAGELIHSAAIPTAISTLTFAVPEDAAIGQTFARFRLHDGITGLLPTGPANAGEVEDYRVDIDFDVDDPEQVALLLASDSSAGDQFGISVAIDGDFALVGSLNTETGGQINTGAAYIYEKNDSFGWSQVARLEAPNPTGADQFGVTVDLHDGVAVVGARKYDVGGATDIGAVFVYELDANGAWLFMETLLAPGGVAGDQFGQQVSINGDTIITSSVFEDFGGNTDNGVAYVFERNEQDSWIYTSTLRSSSPDSHDRFGIDVAVDGDTAIVGAYFDDSATRTDDGAAYVFVRDSFGVWSEQAVLFAPNAESNETFGHSVEVHGDRAIIGAYNEDHNGLTDNGAAYVFDRLPGGTWSTGVTLRGSDPENSDQFGYSVSIEGSTAVVGAQRADTAGLGESGAAYVFTYNESTDTWSEVDKLFTTPIGVWFGFGRSVDLDGKNVVVGAYAADANGQVDTGHAVIADLNSNDTNFGDAPEPYPTLLADDGAVHSIIDGFHLGGVAFSSDDGQPSLEARGKNWGGQLDDDGVTFGQLKIGNTAATVDVTVTNTTGVSAPSLDAWIDFNADGDWDDAGEQIYSAAISSGTNTLTFTVPEDSEIGQTFARFRLHDGPAGLLPFGAAESGEVEDYRINIDFDVSNPAQIQKLLAGNGSTNDQVGNAVFVDGDTAIIGASAENTDGQSNSGAAYIFTRDSGGTWNQHQKLVAGTAQADARFGHAVTLDGNTAVVAAHMEDDVAGGFVDSGSVYVFERDSSGFWSPVAQLQATGRASHDQFGYSVSTDGNTLVVGSNLDDGNGAAVTDAGAVYVFEREALGLWSETSRLQASDLSANDQFGISVSLDADTLLIGAWLANDVSGVGDTGAAYVFERDEFGFWNEHSKLSALNRDASDFFGFSVSLDNDMAIVGSRFDDDPGAGTTNSGAATVFQRQADGQWDWQALLRADDRSSSDRFGISVAIEGDVALVGANFGDGDTVDDTGAAYVFQRNASGSWTQNSKLLASDGDIDDQFGWSIALDQKTAFIGAPRADESSGTGTADNGAVYAFDLLPLSTDLGDAPSPYPTLLVDDGPVHTQVDGFYLGTAWDAETDGQPSLEANGDDTDGNDDEDGVTFDQLKIGDTAATVEVFVTNTAGASDPYLDAWIDFNADGDWDDAGEHFYSAAVTAGTNVLTFAVPDDAAIGQTFARFRLHDGTTGLLPTGPADSGEVEDYRVSVDFDITDPEQAAWLFANDAAVSDSYGFSVSIDGDHAIVGSFREDSGTTTDNGAVYFYKKDPSNDWQFVNKVVPSTAEDVAQFGVSVSISGTWAAVGARFEDAGGLVNSGAAYLLVRDSDGTWSEHSRVTASDASTNDNLGRSISIDGNTVVVGASGESDGFTENGAAYVYTFDGTTWGQQATLRASNAGDFDRFGVSVSIDADTAIIGAYFEDTAASNAGAAYVFDRDAFGNWSETEMLTASDATAGDDFGIAVDVSGNRAIVGAYTEDFDGESNNGAAYIFDRDADGSWNEKAILRASNADTEDHFGYSVAVQGDKAVVGTIDGDTQGIVDSGAAYVFDRDAVTDTWSEVEQLKPNPSQAGDRFGYIIDFDGNQVIAGAYLADPNAIESGGAAFIFDLESASDDWGDAPAPYPTLASEDGPVHAELAGFNLGMTWDDDYNGQPSLEANGDDTNGVDDEDGVTFGQLEIGDTAATVEVFVTNTAGVSDPYLDAWIDFNADGDWDDAGEQITSGSVVAGTNTITFAVPALAKVGETFSRFRLHDGTTALSPTGAADSGEVEDHLVVIDLSVSDPEQVARLLHSDAALGDNFGRSVSVDGDTMIVGAEDAGSSGAAYVFVRDVSGDWIEQAKLVASDGQQFDSFGYSVAVSGDRAVVGAYQEDSGGDTSNGAAYVFLRDASGGWSQQAKLLASNADAFEYFGASVAIDGANVVVGAYFTDDGAESNAGAAYIFSPNASGVWTQQTKLQAEDADSFDYFGRSVSIDGDVVIVGADGEDSGETSSNGAAYVFVKNASGSWVSETKLTASDSTSFSRFGGSVSLDGDTAVIGAYRESSAASSGGAVYVFTRAANGTWSEQSKLVAADAAVLDQLGTSVNIDGDLILVGAENSDSGSNVIGGSAYLFERDDLGNWNQVDKIQAVEFEETNYFGSGVAIAGTEAIVGARSAAVGGVSNTGAVHIFDLNTPNEDLGDAPTPYPTLLADDGPVHSEVAGFSLGTLWDDDDQGQPRLEANGDDVDGSDDDDGVTFGQLKVGDEAATWDIVVTNSAGVASPYLDAWIDFNADGDWDDANEQVYSASIPAGTSTLTFAVPEDATIGQTFARFRLHDGTSPLAVTGPADSGEVEDYRLHIGVELDDPDQLQKLFASDAAGQDFFGQSVAVDGDTAIVGAYFRGSGGEGGAYVYERDAAGLWTEQALLVPPDGDINDTDSAGWSVAIDGDTAVVGAYTKDIGGATDVGAAYVFTRDGSGIWDAGIQLKANDGVSGDWFGWSVTVEDDTVVVGARSEETTGYDYTDNGAAYVFSRDNAGVWSERQKLLATQLDTEYFGSDVDLDGDTLLIGAMSGDGGNGAAYIFERGETGLWTQTTEFTGNSFLGKFGETVSLSGDVAVIGAPEESSVGLSLDGASYVYTRDQNGEWSNATRLIGSDQNDSFAFGTSVSVQGDTLAISAPFRDIDNDGFRLGGLYLFQRDASGAWIEQDIILPNDSSDAGFFGWSLALSGDAVFASNVFDNDFGQNAGAAYFIGLRTPHEDLGDAPSPYPTSLADDGAVHNELAGFTLGTLWDDDDDRQPSALADGDDTDGLDDEDGVTFGSLKVGQSDASVDVFVTNTASVSDPYVTAWIDFNADGDWDDAGEQIYAGSVVTGVNTLTFDVPSLAEPGDTFARFRLHDGTSSLLPTGPAASGEIEDYAVGIDFAIDDPEQIARLLASDAQDSDQYGFSIDVHDDFAIVGARQVGAGVQNIGAAYIYQLGVDGQWVEQQKLAPSDGDGSEAFGSSVALFGNLAVVGAPFEDIGGELNNGAVYLYSFIDGVGWTEQQKLTASDSAAGDWFGGSVNFDGQSIIVGAYERDTANLSNSGAAYVFTKDANGDWSEQASLVASDAAEQDRFGYDVAISGNTAVIGSYRRDSSGFADSGAAYVFVRDQFGGWSEQAVLATDLPSSNDFFGQSVAIVDETVFAGAPGRDIAGENNSGAVYVFGRDSSNEWGVQAELTAESPMTHGTFGHDIAIDGNHLVVGGIGIVNEFPYSSGAIVLFTHDGAGQWSREAQISSLNPSENQFFGYSVAIGGETVFVGDPFADEADDSPGLAYVIDLRTPHEDAGDAPTSYLTDWNDDGPLHTQVMGFGLGTLWDDDDDGLPSPNADGDDATDVDDEDGVAISVLSAGNVASTFSVSITNDANVANPYLDAWFDFNADGDWDDAGEHAVSIPVNAGENIIGFVVPDDAVVGQTFARFRLHDGTSGIAPTGQAASGEVEDYEVTISDEVVINLPELNSSVATIYRSSERVVVMGSSGILSSTPLSRTNKLTVLGSDLQPEIVVVDTQTGGFFEIPEGIHLTGGATLDDSLLINGTGSTQATYRTRMVPAGAPVVDLLDGGETLTVFYEEFDDQRVEQLLTFESVAPAFSIGGSYFGIESMTPVNLGNLTLLGGGTLASTSLIALGSGESIIGSGFIDGRFAGEIGSLVRAEGTLIIGDSSHHDGFITGGNLDVGGGLIQLHDAGQAVLGSLTTLGADGDAGSLSANNGLLVDFGNNVVGQGTIDTPNDIGSLLMLNGSIIGNSSEEQINLPGYVKGVGSISDVSTTGTYSPGFSPAAVYNGSVTYNASSTTVIEIGGTTPGSSGHDQLNHSGTAILGGMLDVQLINGFVPSVGDTFVIVTATGGARETFDTESLPAAPAGSGWHVNYASNAITLELHDLAQVDNIIIGNGNSTSQRSQITQLEVVFEGQVEIDLDAFSFVKRGPDGGAVTTTFSTSSDLSGNTIANLEFSSFTRGLLNALVDGNYQLNIDASKVRRSGTELYLDGDDDGVSGGGYEIGALEADKLYSLFGDANANGIVDFDDFSAFGTAFNVADDVFDFNGNGTIDFDDFSAFGANFNSNRNFQ